MGIVIAISQELAEMVVAACGRSAATRAAATASGLFVTATVGWVVWSLLHEDTQTSRYHVYEVHGAVTYADGGVVPVDMMLVKLFAAARPENIPRIATPVTARVEAQTGRFRAKWIGTKDAFNAATRWRVVILSGDQRPLAKDVVPSEYGDVETTPLEVDLTKSPLQIRLRRPPVITQ